MSEETISQPRPFPDTVRRLCAKKFALASLILCLLYLGAAIFAESGMRLDCSLRLQ